MNKLLSLTNSVVVTYAASALLLGSTLAGYESEPLAIKKAKVSMTPMAEESHITELKPKKSLSPTTTESTEVKQKVQVAKSPNLVKIQEQYLSASPHAKATRVSVPQVEVKQQEKSQQVLLAPIVVLPSEEQEKQDVESRLQLKPKKQQVLHPAVVALPDESPKPVLVLQPKVITLPVVDINTVQVPVKPASKPKWVKPSKTASFSDQSLKVSSKPKRKIYQYEQGGVITFSNIVPDDADFEVLLYDCFACQVNSQVDWHSIPLFAFKHSDFVTDAAEQFELDPALIRAVIHAESAFNAKARSKVGAIGLMQLMPATAKELGVSDAYDIKQNIWGGSQYLAYLLKRFDNDIDLACAAYNAGPTTVTKYQGIPPYPETQAYVERVKILLKRYRAALQS